MKISCFYFGSWNFTGRRSCSELSLFWHQFPSFFLLGIWRSLEKRKKEKRGGYATIKEVEGHQIHVTWQWRNLATFMYTCSSHNRQKPIIHMYIILHCMKYLVTKMYKQIYVSFAVRFQLWTFWHFLWCALTILGLSPHINHAYLYVLHHTISFFLAIHLKMFTPGNTTQTLKIELI